MRLIHSMWYIFTQHFGMRTGKEALTYVRVMFSFAQMKKMELNKESQAETSTAGRQGVTINKDVNGFAFRS